MIDGGPAAPDRVDVPPDLAEPLEAVVRVGEAGVEVVRVERAGARTIVGQAEHMLAYELRDDEGALIVRGRVRDPRYVRAEWPDETGALRHEEGFDPNATLWLRLPPERGTLTIWAEESTGLVQLGQDHFDGLLPGDRAAADGLGTSSAALASQEDVLGPPERLLENGPPETSIDLLFVPDGYTEAEMGAFREVVDRVLRELAAEPDYAARWSGFNIWVQDVRSRESGIDNTPEVGVMRDTAFDTGYFTAGVERCVIPEGAARELAVSLGRAVEADSVVVVSNGPTYGGCAAGTGTRAVVGMTSSLETTGSLLAHELGHDVFGLADEYDGDPCEPHADPPSFPNIAFSSDRATLPWSDLVAPSTPVPTPDDPENATLVGAFEGGHYCATNRWRPQHDCLMNHLDAPFCQVCRRVFDGVLQDAGPGPCGDGLCSGEEVCNACPQDCGYCRLRAVCGDGQCQTSETYDSCAEDCPRPRPRACAVGCCDSDSTVDLAWAGGAGWGGWRSGWFWRACFYRASQHCEGRGGWDELTYLGRTTERMCSAATPPSADAGAGACPDASCNDSLGREICAGGRGAVQCPEGGIQTCTCSPSGEWESCGACFE